MPDISISRELTTSSGRSIEWAEHQVGGVRRKPKEIKVFCYLSDFSFFAPHSLSWPLPLIQVDASPTHAQDATKICIRAKVTDVHGKVYPNPAVRGSETFPECLK